MTGPSYETSYTLCGPWQQAKITLPRRVAVALGWPSRARLRVTYCTGGALYIELAPRANNNPPTQETTQCDLKISP